MKIEYPRNIFPVDVLPGNIIETDGKIVTILKKDTDKRRKIEELMKELYEYEYK